MHARQDEISVYSGSKQKPRTVLKEFIVNCGGTRDME